MNFSKNLLHPIVLSIIVTTAGCKIRKDSAKSPDADATTSTSTMEWQPSSKKGVGTWFSPNVEKNIRDLQVSWYFNWKSNPEWIRPLAGVEFVPMIWSKSSVTESELSDAKKYGKILFSFEEPDSKDEEAMSVSEALDLWPRLMATGLELCTPALAGDPSLPGSWLEQFMVGVKSRGYRVEKLCLHWFGKDFNPDAATLQLKKFIEAAYEKYQLPIWLTQYALIDWDEGPRYPSAAIQAKFATLSTVMLDELTFVERYAWFSMPQYSSSPEESSYLYNPDGSATIVGKAYRQSGSATE